MHSYVCMSDRITYGRMVGSQPVTSLSSRRSSTAMSSSESVKLNTFAFAAIRDGVTLFGNVMYPR